MSAEEVRRRSFSAAFRGFDQAEVRGFLERVAEELDDADRREKELRSELRDARDRILHPRLDEATLTSALGQEAAQILHSAHEAAADVRRKAEEHAARVLGEAHREGERIRAAAETVMGEHTTEAEAAADAIRAAAEAEAGTVLGRARHHAEAALLEARSRCDALAEEADSLKGRVLGDLARRRRVMNAQVEQLGAGRESILRALQEVRRLLDQTVDSLDRVASEAKGAADEALNRALNEPEPGTAELERDAGPALASPLDGLTAVLAGLDESLASIAATGVPTEPAEPIMPTEAGMPTETTEAPGAAPVPELRQPAAAVGPSIELAPAPAAEAPAQVGDGPEEPSDEPETETLTEMERRGSLRLLRRGRPRASTEQATSYAAEPGEGVRLIRTTPAPDAPGNEEAGADIVAAEVATAADATTTDVTTTDAPPTDVTTADEKSSSVDELFARLRAQRAVAREHAHAVLSETEDAGGAGDAAEADGAGESVSSESEDQTGAEADSEESEAPFVDMRNRMLGSVQERMARRLKRTLQDDQNDVLDRVRGISRGRPGPVLPEEADHRRAYATAVEPLVEEAYRAGALFAAEVFPDAAPLGTGPNGDVADALATEVVVQLRSRLTALFDGPEGEEADLADGASAAYRAWKGDRVESLAMDYVVDSFAAGVLAAVPNGTALRWVVDDDGGPCPDCDDNALAGPTAAGQSFPTGQQHPPAHPGCRCLLAPVLT